jgi:hypothetical protein
MTILEQGAVGTRKNGGLLRLMTAGLGEKAK